MILKQVIVNYKKKMRQVVVILLSAFLCIGFLIACNDFMTYKIPNSLLLTSIGIYLLRNSLYGRPEDLIQPGCCAALTLVVGFVLFLIKVAGAGDAKYLAVATLWMTDYNLFHFFILITLLGGGTAIIYLIAKEHIFSWRFKLLAHFTRLSDSHFLKKIFVIQNSESGTDTYFDKKIDDGKVIPYGVPIFLATLILSYKTILGLNL